MTTISQSISPLQAIHQKETELRRRLEETRQQAEASIQTARDEARKLVAQADQQGRAEAKAFFEQGLVAVQQEAVAIVNAAREEEVVLQQRVAADLDEAARQIMKLALP
jgi:vacuolar-type H+-ATPase subunit H